MDAGDPSIDALLAAARAEFAASLPAKVAAIDASLARGAWEDARRGAHKLRGSAAVYGFEALAAFAGDIEDHLRGADPPGEQALDVILGRLAQASLEAERAASGAT